MDEFQRQEVHLWMIKSQRDLEAAHVLFESQASLLDIVVYHCQQSAEKALKAYLTYRCVLFPKTHDLETLLDLCLPFASGFVRLQDMAEDLTPYATMFRYPGSVIAPASQEAKEAIEKADYFFNFVLSVLPDGILCDEK